MVRVFGEQGLLDPLWWLWAAPFGDECFGEPADDGESVVDVGYEHGEGAGVLADAVRDHHRRDAGTDTPNVRGSEFVEELVSAGGFVHGGLGRGERHPHRVAIDLIEVIADIGFYLGTLGAHPSTPAISSSVVALRVWLRRMCDLIWLRPLVVSPATWWPQPGSSH